MKRYKNIKSSTKYDQENERLDNEDKERREKGIINDDMEQDSNANINACDNTISSYNPEANDLSVNNISRPIFG